MGDDCGGLTARITALEKMLDEREDRTKERFAAMERSVNIAMVASDRAVTKAEDATNKRFEGVNEFRQTLADQASGLMPRNEYTVQHKSLQEKVDALMPRAEYQVQHKALSERIDDFQSIAVTRIGLLDQGYANLQGRIWAVGAIWSVLVVAVSVGVRFIGH